MKTFNELMTGHTVLVLFKDEMGPKLRDVATGEIVSFKCYYEGTIEYEIVAQGVHKQISVDASETKYEDGEAKVYTSIEELLEDNFNLNEY